MMWVIPLKAICPCFSTCECGDISDSRSLQSLLVSTVHESLHTVGLDHCTVFECVMNASQSSEADNPGTLIPCSVCESKLTCMFGQEGTTRDRLARLKTFCEEERFERDGEIIAECILQCDTIKSVAGS